jgi:hypothetical protein
MKKCALASALVLAISTVAWGYQFTGIMVTPASPIGICSISMIVSVPGFIQCFECDHFIRMCPVSPGCGTSPCHTWTGHWYPCPGSNNSTSSTASTSTSATGPSGSGVADSSSHSTSGNSSSTSTSHSQSSATNGSVTSGS